MGHLDTVPFFRILKTAFPAATALFVEGTSVAEDVQEFYNSASEPGPYLPASRTIWPRPKRFCLRADDPTLKLLAEMAASHAEPEILDHLFVYAGTEPLMEYPDAFGADCPMFVSREAVEGQVRWFAEELQLKVVKVGMA